MDVRCSYAGDPTPRSCNRPEPKGKGAPVARRAFRPVVLARGCFPGGRAGSVRGRRLVGLRRRRVTQFLAQDLADVALGQLVAELDLARLLVAGQRLAAV